MSMEAINIKNETVLKTIKQMTEKTEEPSTKVNRGFTRFKREVRKVGQEDHTECTAESKDAPSSKLIENEIVCDGNEQRTKVKRDFTLRRKLQQEQKMSTDMQDLSTGKTFKESQTCLQIENQCGHIASSPLPSNFLAENNKNKDNNNSIMTYTPGDPALVIVRFHINNETFASAFKSERTVGEIKESLADVLDLEENFIMLENNNIEVEDIFTVRELNGQSCSGIDFQLKSTEGKEGKKLIETKVKENIPSIDVITVHLGEGGDKKDIVVEIENQCCVKEWLGGYRNKLTNIEYHNAITQTSPKKKEVFMYSKTGEYVPFLYNRDTQTTFKPKEIIIATTVNKATQMWRADLYINPKTDKIITSKPYVCYDDWYKLNNNEKAIITIQRALRSYIHGRRITNLISLQKALLADMKKQREQILKEQDDKERGIITGSVYPVKCDDFYILYLMVSKWWKREWKRICSLRTVEPKKAEAVALLTKEVKLLESIERHSIVIKEEALKKENMRFLEQTSRPFTFKNSKGKMTSIEDVKTQKAKQFKEVYSELIRKDTLPNDRIDVLLILKNLFITHFIGYEYANDLISLIQREINLLTIGMKIDHVCGLHKRIEQLYMYFLRQEEFNPKAASYKKPNTPKTKHRLFQCSRCLKLLPVNKYPVHVRMTAYTECKSCVWQHNIGGKRVDMSPFLKLLKAVQNSEMEKCCYSAVCFILQPIGMGHLTNVIWHGHSAISECNDLSKLQHIRWLSDVEWAPWNTILLTDQEAKCHASISDVFTFYGKSFIENVWQKHILARKCFDPLLKMDHDIRTSGVWASITDSGAFIHPSHAEIIAAEGDYDRM